MQLVNKLGGLYEEAVLVQRRSLKSGGNSIKPCNLSHHSSPHFHSSKSRHPALPEYTVATILYQPYQLKCSAFKIQLS